MDRCSACGTACSASAKFCPACGIRISSRASTPHTATAVSVPYGVYLAGGGAAVLPPGTLLQGRYRIERVLGSGAFGRVYLAQDLQDAAQPSVAIKELLDAQFSTPEEKHEAVLWFKREASTLLTLEHPGIPAIYTYWTAQRSAGPFYLAMEYIPGQTLEGVLQNAGGRVAWQKVVAWGIALCDVLSYLHSRTPPVVFRDLKLPNIMLNSATNALVLIDFGIARQLAPVGQRSAPGAMCPTSRCSATPIRAATSTRWGPRCMPWSQAVTLMSNMPGCCAVVWMSRGRCGRCSPLRIPWSQECPRGSARCSQKRRHSPLLIAMTMPHPWRRYCIMHLGRSVGGRLGWLLLRPPDRNHLWPPPRPLVLRHRPSLEARGRSLNRGKVTSDAQLLGVV